MSTDNSQPRIKLIFTVIVISVTTLVGLKFVFDSYFISRPRPRSTRSS